MALHSFISRPMESSVKISKEKLVNCSTKLMRTRETISFLKTNLAIVSLWLSLNFSRFYRTLKLGAIKRNVCSWLHATLNLTASCFLRQAYRMLYARLELLVIEHNNYSLMPSTGVFWWKEQGSAKHISRPSTPSSGTMIWAFVKTGHPIDCWPNVNRALNACETSGFWKACRKTLIQSHFSKSICLYSKSWCGKENWTQCINW